MRHESVDEMTRTVGADSLQFLSLQGLFDSVGKDKGFCDACFTGDYLIPLIDHKESEEGQLSLF